ncbi:MAG: hypothetical protein JKY02_01550 [Flavobacteriaceae bacterium]|nr:hypothetical protein [Flavobacteriaceae bacterium]
MKQKIILILFCAFLIACGSKSRISKDLDCNPESYSNLEKIEDVKKLFTVQFPDNWKTNLYYDKNQSSIYTADTTKQLTETMLLDITHVSNELKLEGDFIKNFKTSLLNQQLIETTSYELIFQDKEAYYSMALGKKNTYSYQILNLFIKINTNNYIHAKAEVYGDSIVNQRICNALNLIEKIEY